MVQGGDRGGRGGGNVRSRRDVQVAYCADAVEAVFEGREGRGLREKHEEAIEAFIEVGVFLGLEELEAEVWRWGVSGGVYREMRATHR